MIKYHSISEAHAVQHRLKRNSYGRPWGETEHTRASDQLILFTLKPQALADSAHNLELVLNVAREHDQDLVVLKPHEIQVAGRGWEHLEQVNDRLYPESWKQQHQTWLETSATVDAVIHSTGHGRCSEFYTYRPSLVMQQHQGVYDVATGQRLTNRNQIIDRMWQLGFAARRGRPLSIARQRWSGNREELELIAQLAEQHWDRQFKSDVARKIISTYRSINRYCAWPGAW
jgi:hypothetical protein